MNRNVLFAIMLALLGIGYFYYQSQQAQEAQRLQQEKEARERLEALAKQAREGKVNVLKANVALPANTRVPETAVRVESIAKDFAPADTQLRPEEVIDKYTTESIPKDDIINKKRLTDTQRTLESFLQEGERFYAVRVDGVNAVTGYVKQGDRVDIVAVMTYGTTQFCRTILSNLEIFSVNSYRWEMTAEDKKKGDLGGLTITFKLTGQQASRLIQLLQLGAQPRFMLRPPSDIDKTVTPGITLEQLVNDERPGMKKAVNVGPAKEGEPPPMMAIQVIRYKDISQEMFPLQTYVVDATAADVAPLPPAVQAGGPAPAPATTPPPLPPKPQ